MNCSHCNASATRQLKQTTVLGYDQYYCRSCCSQFNERSGTEFNFIEYRTEVVMLAVYYYFRFKVSFDDKACRDARDRLLPSLSIIDSQYATT